MIYKWNILGHEKKLERLERDIEENNLYHAYLFIGPTGVGKKLIAKTFAKILQCENNFCKKCHHCIQIDANSHFDTIILEDEREAIKIEKIKEIIQNLILTVQAKYKIIIIENIERMTRESANALLKTLEEPNRKTIFLLTSSAPNELPKTIISRTRVMKFNAFSSEKLKEELKKNFEEENLDKIEKAVSFSMGLPARSIQLLKNEDLLNKYQRIYNEIVKFLEEEKSVYKRFNFIEEILKEPEDVEIFLEILFHILRKKTVDNAYIENKTSQETKELIKIIEKGEKAKKLIKRNVNAKLLFENLILSL